MAQFCFVWSHVGRGPSQPPFVSSQVLWIMGGAPSFGVSPRLRPQCFLGSTFVTIWQDVISFHNPLYFYVHSLTNPLHTNIMLAWGPAVVPCLGMGIDPHCHKISYTSVLARVDLGQSGHLRCQNALSAGFGPTAHRMSQHARCSPASHARVSSRACLGAASSVHLPTLLLAVSLSTKPALIGWRIGTFRKPALKSNIGGPEAIKEGFHSVGTAVPPPVRIHMQATAGGPWPLLLETRDKAPL